MLRKTLLVGIVCATTLGCAQKLTRQEKAVQEQVLQDRATEWMRVLNNQEQDQLATFYHQGIELTVAWFDGHRTRGWDEESLAVEQFFRDVATLNLGLQDLVVDVLSPTIALSTFRYSADVILTTSDRDIFTGQATVVWIKDDAGEWRIYAEQMSRDP
jgi:ketosteroid isomerase-like protein